MQCMPDPLPGELPSLRAYLRLGDQVEGSTVAVSFYDVKFYPFTEPTHHPVLALVGANTYHPSTAIEVLRVFEDLNISLKDLANREHQINSVCWTRDAESADPVVIVANDVQQIKLLNVKTGKLLRTLIGHGSAINDLVVCPTDPNILASCSMDYTIRIWNLAPEFKTHPCVAICAHGHREGILAISWHHSGRFLLSGGHDAVVNLWAIPDLPTAPTDHIVKILWPHFSSNEVHNDYIDCVQWFGNSILSRAGCEHRVLLWRIDGFDPGKYALGEPLPQAPGPQIYKPSCTRSAFGDGWELELTFEVKFSALFYMRFALFHQPGKHPVLCAGNERSKVHFWDLHQLGRGPPGQTTSLRWAGHSKKSAGTASTSGEPSEPGDIGTPSAVGEHDDREPSPRHDAAFRKPRTKKRDTEMPAPGARPSLQRSESAHSDTTCSHMADAPPDLLLPRGAGRKSSKDPKAKYGIDDPFRQLKPHKAVVVPKVGFCVRQVAWSPGGEWCAVCGDNGMLALFSRWMK